MAKQRTRQWGRSVSRVLLAAFVILACTSAQLKTMTGTFATCGKADLGQIVTGADGKPAALEAAVAAIIEGNGAALEATLGALAVVVGIDAIDCAIAAVEAAFVPAIGSGSAAPATNELVTNNVRAGIARAHVFVSSWRAEAAKAKAGTP